MTVNMVPVLDLQMKPLMPCNPGRARFLMKNGKATGLWVKGVFCVRLNQEPSCKNLQTIAVGVDPGSKKEGFTVKSRKKTFINIQSDAPVWVKDKIGKRRFLRKARRYRKTPYRKARFYRQKGKEHTPSSTMARWDLKLRICKWLSSIFPVECFVVEDIKAESKKGARKWNRSFSPLQIGKNWFYSQLEKCAQVKRKFGFETKALRDNLGLTKTNKKLLNVFNAHCVDSWVLANWFTGGHLKPDNQKISLLSPININRRQLHMVTCKPGGCRKRYGGTKSLSFKKGSWISHNYYGIKYVGGFRKNRITLHDLKSGKRVTQNASVKDCKMLNYCSWRFYSDK